MRNCNKVIAIARTTINPEEGEPAALEYSLCQKEGLEGEILYSLRVDKRNLGGELIEREETPPLTGSLADAIACAEAFAKGTVPPAVLLEMIDEWYDSYFESDFPTSIHSAGE